MAISNVVKKFLNDTRALEYLNENRFVDLLHLMNSYMFDREVSECIDMLIDAGIPISEKDFQEYMYQTIKSFMDLVDDDPDYRDYWSSWGNNYLFGDWLDKGQQHKCGLSLKYWEDWYKKNKEKLFPYLVMADRGIIW